MTAAIFIVLLSTCCNPRGCVHEHHCSLHTRGVLTVILVLLVFLKLHAFLFLSRLCRVIGFLRQFVLKATVTQLRLPLTPFHSLPFSLSLPLLYSQGLVLVLIKAVPFCLLPAFSTACCVLRGNSDTEWREKRWWLIPEHRESKLWVILPSSQSEKLPSQGQMPGIGSLYCTVWCLLSSQTFSTMPSLLLLLRLPPPCCGVWFEGVLWGDAGLLSAVV